MSGVAKVTLNTPVFGGVQGNKIYTYIVKYTYTFNVRVIFCIPGGSFPMSDLHGCESARMKFTSVVL